MIYAYINMPLQVTLVTEHDQELSPGHFARGLRLPEDIRVNRVFYVDSRYPDEPVETLVNRLHRDDGTGVKESLYEASPPTKVIGKQEQEEVLMEGRVPHVYTDADSPYKLKAKVALMNEDLQLLALENETIEAIFAPPPDWVPPPASMLNAEGKDDDRGVVRRALPQDRMVESIRKRKSAMKQSMERVEAVKHSATRAAFQRLSVARKPRECVEFAEQHWLALNNQDFLISDIKRLLEELKKDEDSPNYKPTQALGQRHYKKTNLQGKYHEEDEEKIDLQERLDCITNVRKKEILASLERRERLVMRKGRSASLQRGGYSRRGSSLRHRSLANVGSIQPTSATSSHNKPLASIASMQPSSPSGSMHSSSSSPPKRRGSRFFSPIHNEGQAIQINRGEVNREGCADRREQVGKGGEDAAGFASSDEGERRSDIYGDVEIYQDKAEEDNNEDEDVEEILRRLYSNDEPVPTLRYYSAGPSNVVSEEGEVLLRDCAAPDVSRVERDRRVTEISLKARLLQRGEELGLYTPQFVGEQPEMRSARKSCRDALHVRRRLEEEVGEIRKERNRRRTKNIITEARLGRLQKHVSDERERLENSARVQVDDHHYHLPSKLHSWYEKTKDMLTVGEDATVVPVDKLDKLMMWWHDSGAGDEGHYNAYLRQHEQVHRQQLRTRMNEALLGGGAATHADAHTFITEQKALEENTGKETGAGFVNLIGRENVRETIRIGGFPFTSVPRTIRAQGDEEIVTRTTNPNAANFLSEKKEIFHVHGPQEAGKRSIANERKERKKRAERKLSDAAALRELQLSTHRLSLSRVRDAEWLVCLLNALKAHVDERLMLADLQRQSNKSRAKGQTETEEEKQGGVVKADLSTGLLQFSLALAHAVQLGFTLNSDRSNSGGGGGGDGDGDDDREEKGTLVLSLFRRCFAVEELRNEAIFPIVMHAMAAAGIATSQLLHFIRSEWGSSVGGLQTNPMHSAAMDRVKQQEVIIRAKDEELQAKDERIRALEAASRSSQATAGAGPDEFAI